MAIDPQGHSHEAGGNINRIAEDAKNKAREAGAAVKQRAEGAIGSVGQQMSNLGGALREKAPHEGALGNAASSVADTMQAGGRYLQEHDLEDLSREVSNLVRRYPYASLGLCFGVGCLLGMTWNRR